MTEVTVTLSDPDVEIAVAAEVPDLELGAFAGVEVQPSATSPPAAEIGTISHFLISFSTVMQYVENDVATMSQKLTPHATSASTGSIRWPHMRP